MSIVLETCTACHGTGVEVYAYSTHPFGPAVRERCFDCDGTGQVPVMLTGTELSDFILGHDKPATQP
jgi:DnaJ-class molecular chaperone